MKTNFFIFVIIFFLTFVIVANLFTQETREKPDLITDKKIKLLILPAAGTDFSTNSIDAEITSTVAGIAAKLQRFEVIDRNNLSEILEEQALHQTGLIDDSTAISLGKIAASDEALIVTVTNFSQAGVAPSDYNDEDDDDQSFGESIISSIVEGIFSSGSDEDESDPYPDNIQTQLSVQVRKIDVETGKSLDSYDISVYHTGGTRGVSRAKAIEKFKAATINELKGLYLLSSEVISVDGNEALLFLGSNVGVEQKTLFEIVRPNKIKKINGKQFTVPGRSAGFVCVTDFSRESNRSEIIRQWRPIEPGYSALEYPGSIHGFQIYFLPRFPGEYLYLGGQYHASPIADCDFGLNLRYVELTDSYNEKDRGFGIGGFAGKRIFVSSPLQFNGKIGIDLDMLFRKDDENHTVYIPILSATVGINISYLLSRKSDLEINFGYRFSVDPSGWKYSENEKTHDAVWHNPAPEINISDIFITVGYKFIIL